MKDPLKETHIFNQWWPSGEMEEALFKYGLQVERIQIMKLLI